MTKLQPLLRRAASAGRTWAWTALFPSMLVLAVHARGAPLCGAAAAQPPATAASAEFVGTAVQRSAMGLHVSNCRGDQRVFSLDDKRLQSVPPGAIVGLVHEPQLQEGKSAYRVIEPPRILGGLLHGRFVELAEDKGSLLLRAEAPGPVAADQWKLTATGCLAHPAAASAPRLMSLRNEGDVKGATALLRRDDAVCISFQEAGLDGKPVTPLALHVEWQAEGWGGDRAALVLAVTAALVAGATWLLLGCKPPWLLFLGQDNRYSTSKFQGVIWFWVLISAYLAILVQRAGSAGLGYFGGVDIPENLLILSGLSAVTVAGAKVITSSKVDAANARDPTLADGGKPPASVPRLTDLVRDDLNRADFGDFQSVVITVIAVAVYAVAVVEFMTLVEFRHQIEMPDVNSTLLALFGLGQAAYLGKKAAGEVAGMTAQQAITRCSELALTIQKLAARADAAAQTAEKHSMAAQKARADAEAATGKAAAEGAAADARKAAVDARSAEHDASAADKQAATDLAELEVLSAAWANDATAGPLTTASKKLGETERGNAAKSKQSAVALAAQADADAAAAAGEVASKS